MSKILMVILAACFCAASGVAQNRVMIGSHATGGRSPGAVGHPGVPPGARRTTVRISGNGFERRGFHRPFRGAGFIGGYGWPYFYDDYAESYEPEPAPAAQATTVAPVQVKAEPVPDPVLLELRGTQWVKVNSFTSAAATDSGVLAQVPAQAVPAKASAPAVLVYRDGHSEELNSYSIIGPVIYTKGDYWSSGNGTRKIQIADLDLPATLKQNQDRGVKFELPSGPDEVMIRP
jgi:hypothetical protein